MNVNFKEEVTTLMRSGKTSDALTILLESSVENKSVQESVNMIIAEFNALNKERIKGTVQSEELTRKSNVINDKILIVLNFFNDGGTILPGVKVPRTGKSTRILLKLGLTILIIGLCLFLISYFFEDHLGGNFNMLTVVVCIYMIQGGVIVLACWLVAFLWQAVKGN